MQKTNGRITAFEFLNAFPTVQKNNPAKLQSICLRNSSYPVNLFYLI